MVDTDLSSNQKAILDFIKSEVRIKGYPPSVREIGHAVGLKSTSSVHGNLEKLEEKGYIRRDPTKPRAIEVLDENRFISEKGSVNVPILGRILADGSLVTSENIEDYFHIPVDYIGTDTCFILIIEGNSMADRGILDGDFIVVKEQSSGDHGDIVVTLIEDKMQIKTFCKKDQIHILGKVIGTIRIF